MRTPRRTRQILAVTLLATALCADRFAVTSPAPRPSAAESMGPRVGQMARTLAARLAGAFRRTGAPVRFRQERREGAAVGSPAPALARVPALRFHTPLSPFQFRLPPPVAA